ncbi:hypothetical protein QFZ94_003354 [Paraburkholderia sp. JPY465]|uniref:SDH family Clp fold serine proteinase n=1 Tax=Paraburkholderia sp. JPY465 TaxID=3042285 RepID=UPI003D1B8818
MTSFQNRSALFDQIGQLRNSRVISYITGDRRELEAQISSEIIDIFVDHLDEIGPVQKLSLILHTNGGDTAAAWRLVNLLHTFCEELEVIVPAKALSAGTLISLGANQLVMTKQAALGPIDPSVNHALNPTLPNAPHVRVPVSVEAVRGYLDAAKDFGIDDGAHRAQLLLALSEKIHPLVLGQIFRSRSQIRFLAKKLLVRQVQNEEKSKEIIDFLCAESGSHDYTINRREARELGLNVENPSQDLYVLLRQVHQSYVAEMQLLEPYDPFGLLASSQSVTYSLPRAMIESSPVGSHRFVSEGVLTKTIVQQQTMTGMVQQESVNDNRRFEGWRKV